MSHKATVLTRQSGSTEQDVDANTIDLRGTPVTFIMNQQEMRQQVRRTRAFWR
ncbi:MAG: hypothetical protein O2931_04130 [Planctomycetota bacterium]|nr:hypothetical protein [Planctomycetota bacterium]MDA1177968.1 hypothetical protein [Planctomycetota bacterium]